MANSINNMTESFLRANPSPYGRRVLPFNSTASLQSTPGHHCNSVNPERVKYKVNIRSTTSYFRFMFAGIAKCKTFRGRTHLQGRRAHCQNRCQAAHASLAPNLKHDKVQTLYRTVQQPGGQNTLSPFSKKLYQEIVQISPGSCPNPTVRKIFKKARSHFLLRLQEKVRNLTVDNPRASNQLDCFLEKTMRKTEDVYAEKCARLELTPERATFEFYREYLDRLNVAAQNLNKRARDWRRYLELEDILREGNFETTETAIAQLKRHIQEFLDVKRALIKSLEGTPSFAKAIRNAPMNSLNRALATLLRTQFSLSILHKLDNFDASRSHINRIETEAMTANLKNYFDEVAYQSEAVCDFLEKNPDQLRTQHFGVKKNGKRVAPNAEELQSQIINMILKKPATPLFGP